jgi:hypothetical protein
MVISNVRSSEQRVFRIELQVLGALSAAQQGLAAYNEQRAPIGSW